MKKVTSHDVAELAGVSQSAVSRAFTPGASVSRKTQEKVWRAATVLGYTPNVLARSLITGRSRIIGLVVANLQNQLYPKALELLSLELKREGYHILVYMTPSQDAQTERIVADLLDYQVDGIIAASVSLSETLAERCNARGIPLLLFNRGQSEGGPPSVTSDNIGGATQVVDFLIKGGHKRIAHISGLRESSTGHDREAGFRNALNREGLEPSHCVAGNYSYKIAAEAVRNMFDKSGDPPDAIFAASDHMAFAAMDTIRYDFGLAVPGDVSVAGFDDVPLASWKSYDLTTMRQPLELMVKKTVRTLLARIANPEHEADQKRLSGTLIVRGSARIPENWNS